MKSRMKYFVLLLSLFIGVSCSAQENASGIKERPASTDSQTVPVINQKILDYVEKNKGKTIARGECWDVVSAALNESGANWQSPTGFGKQVDMKSTIPGDVIVFENTVFKSESYTQSFGGHYAIVYAVNDDGTITLAHQNYNNVRKIRFDPINPSHLVEGELTFFRPQE